MHRGIESGYAIQEILKRTSLLQDGRKRPDLRTHVLIHQSQKYRLLGCAMRGLVIPSVFDIDRKSSNHRLHASDPCHSCGAKSSIIVAWVAHVAMVDFVSPVFKPSTHSRITDITSVVSAARDQPSRQSNCPNNGLNVSEAIEWE